MDLLFDANSSSLLDQLHFLHKSCLLQYCHYQQSIQLPTTIRFISKSPTFDLSQTALDTWVIFQYLRPCLSPWTCSPNLLQQASWPPLLSQACKVAWDALSQHQRLIQQLLNMDPSNDHWGDTPSLLPASFGSLQKSIAENYYQLHGAIKAILQLDAHLAVSGDQSPLDSASHPYSLPSFSMGMSACQNCYVVQLQ